MNRIEVISFGGATPVRSTPETPFRRCVNYYSVNDPLLFLNPSAETALRSGFNHKHTNNGNTDDIEDEFCFLAPRLGDPIADHMLLGPTYASALEWEGRRFEHRYHSYMRRMARYALLTSLAIFQTILQLVAGVWRIITNLLSEWKIRRCSMVRSCIAIILAIRSWIITIATALLARIVAGICGLGDSHSMKTSSTTIATPTAIGKGSVMESTPEATALSDSPTLSSSDKISATISTSMLHFIRQTQVTDPTPEAKH